MNRFNIQVDFRDDLFPRLGDHQSDIALKTTISVDGEAATARQAVYLFIQALKGADFANEAIAGALDFWAMEMGAYKHEPQPVRKAPYMPLDQGYDIPIDERCDL